MQTDLNRRAVRAVLHRVIQQIHQHLLEPQRVDQRLQVLGRNDRDRMALRQILTQRHHLLDERRQVRPPWIDRQLARTKARDVEQLVHEARQLFGLCPDGPQRA